MGWGYVRVSFQEGIERERERYILFLWLKPKAPVGCFNFDENC